MRNRTRHTSGCEWREVVVAFAIVAISFPAAIAQTTLRFVAPENGASAARSPAVAAERTASTTSPRPAEVSELRVLAITDSAVRSGSTQSIAPTAAPRSGLDSSQPSSIKIVQQSPSGATELRFLGDLQAAPAAPVSPTLRVAVKPAPQQKSTVVFEPAARAVVVARPMPRPSVIEPKVESAQSQDDSGWGPATPATPIAKSPPPRPMPVSTPQPRPIEYFAAPSKQPEIVKTPVAVQVPVAKVTDRVASLPAKSSPVVAERAPVIPNPIPRSGGELFSGLPQLKLEAPEPAKVAEPTPVIVFHPSQAGGATVAALKDVPRTDRRPLAELFIEAIPAQPQPAKTLVVNVPKPAPTPATVQAPVQSPPIAKAEPVKSEPITVVPVAPSKIASAFENLKPIAVPPVKSTESRSASDNLTAAPARPVAPPIVAATPPASVQVARPAVPPQSVAATTVCPPAKRPAPVVEKPLAAKPAAQPAPRIAVAAPTPAAPVAKSEARPATVKLAPHYEVAMQLPPPASTVQAPAPELDNFAQGLAAGPNFPHTSASLAEAATRGITETYQPSPATHSNTYSYAAATVQPTTVPKYRFFMATDSKPEATPQPAEEGMSAPSDGMLLTDSPVLESLPCNCGRGSGAYASCPYGPGQSGTPYVCGVDCGRAGASCNAKWRDERPIPWSLFGPGEYVGPARPEHVSTYYLRVNDFLTLTFIESRQKSAERYRIGVGDQLRVEWLPGNTNSDAWLNREIIVQPDGSVTLPMVGEVNAAGKTIPEFQDEVVQLYSKFQREPQITVTPMQTNIGIQDILKAVIGRNTSAGQVQELRVTPEGTIQAAGIGSVYVQGLTLDELRSELEARYAAKFGPGLLISPALTEHAINYVFMGGEVRAPGRYTLEGPTTVMQAIAMAGGWNNGGNTREVVVFRRDENWCLKATKINLLALLYGKDPCPTNDVWLRDNDMVLVPKERILCATDVIELYFTRGVYAVFPINYVYDFSKNTAITPVP